MSQKQNGVRQVSDRLLLQIIVVILLLGMPVLPWSVSEHQG